MTQATQTEREFRVNCPLGDDKLLLKGMQGTERLGRLFDFSLDLLSEDENLNPDDILGKNVTVAVDTQPGNTRYLDGICTRFSQVGQYRNFFRYQAQLRPWFWLLTRTSDCKIFQEMTVPDVIKQVLRDAGFSDFKDKTTRTYREWEYLVQYRETTFNFISRLMEQEGIYYYFEHSDGKHELVFADDYASHETFPQYSTVEFYAPGDGAVREEDHLDQWSQSHEIQTVDYVLDSYDFKRPKTDLEAKANQSRKHSHADKELFDFYGEYLTTGDGRQYATNRLEELQSQHETVRGSGDCRGIACGYLFELDGHSNEGWNKEYLVTGSTYDLRQDWFETTVDGKSQATFDTSLTGIESQTPFRPARTTPKPQVTGLETAVVTGPGGEEIWTDEHGRIKVQFHWDRHGKYDENSSCWMRVKQTMAGKAWGAIWIPRIGHEVVVEFIAGDPDQPLVTGVVYNGDNPVPYKLPDNQTQGGVKTRSSKDGSPDNFNELRFEDKKDEEHIYFHAEKDFKRVVENNDELEVGFEDKDKGDQDIKIYNDQNRTVGNNQTLKVGHDIKKPGDQETKIYNDQRLVVGNNQIVEIGHELANPGDQEITIKHDQSLIVGNMQQIAVEDGDRIITVDSGNLTTTVSMGDVTTDVSIGKTTHTATTSIELKCGGSSIKLDPVGITIKAPSVKITGDMAVDIVAAMTTVKGNAMLTLKGGLTMIN